MARAKYYDSTAQEWKYIDMPIVQSSMPSGTNTGDILVWNGSAWETKQMFQPIEYIEGTGTQYIDLGVILTSSNDIEIDAYLDSSLSNYSFLFGASGTSTGWYYQDAFFACNSEPQYGNEIEVSRGATSNPQAKCGNQIGKRIKMKTNGVDVSLTVDGVTTQHSGAGNPQDTTRTAYLFYVNAPSINTKNMAKMKLYSFKIYSGADVVKNYTPVFSKLAGKAGLLETISGQFLSGIGDFVKGADV